MTDEFKQRLDDGESLDSLMPEAFATVREAAKRVLGQRHFDVQMMGGAALHLGNIAEMKTGEGKTLVATLPSYLNALTGQGVHVVTVNDYLAKYHAEWMGRVHHFLGLTDRRDPARHDARGAPRRPTTATSPTRPTTSSASTTCATTWPTRSRTCVQRPRTSPIVDEVDSILIDEARTPLIISGPTQDEVEWYAEFAKVAARLTKDEDYEVDEKKKTISILEPGITKVEDYLGIENLYESANTPLISFLNNSIKAKELFRNDKEYVVIEGEVLIVDEHTGRILSGRRYNDGLHQAIEAKEGVTVREEYQTLATITLQNYFRLYEQALRHDRYGDDRGLGVRQDLQARRRTDPDQQADGPHRPARPGLPHRGGRSSTRSSTTSPSATAPVSRCWSAPPRSRSPSCSPAC